MFGLAPATLSHALLQRWIVPHHYKLMDSSRYQVVKPAHGTGGLGLRVLADLNDVTKADVQEQSGLIAQQYITSPLLLDNRKFSVRLYAVSCISVLRNI